MDDLSSTTGVVALIAAGIAVVALLACAALAWRLRRLRRAQRLVLGERGERDLVEHAREMEAGVEKLTTRFEGEAEALADRLDVAERRLTDAISGTAVVRYDAYNELSGRQSSSVALVDDRGSGLVLSTIVHRDQARVYAKPVVEGDSELELSPEERAAVEEASASGARR